MMKIRTVCRAVLCLWSVPAGLPGQPADQDSLLRAPLPPGNPDLESVVRLSESASNVNVILDRLLSLQDHPLDLNTVTMEELRSVPGISGTEARAVIALRLRLGTFETVRQLDSLEKDYPALPAKLGPYVDAGPALRGPRRTSRPAITARSRVQQDLQLERGFLDGSYGGSRLNAYQRIGAAMSDAVVFGCLAEKDAGELWAQGFASAFLDVQAKQWRARAIVGDYHVGAGQGLVSWSSASFERGIGGGAFVRRTGGGVEPNRSADESRCLRGLALSASPIPGLTAAAFFSSRDRAGSLNDAGELTSFDVSGLYRTDSEMLRRHAVHDRTLGGRLTAGLPGAWDIGLTVTRTDLSVPLVPDRTREFRGQTISVTGIDGKLETGDVLWFAEAAHTAGGGTAAVGGAVAGIGLRTEVAVACRSYEVDYATLYGAGFGQGEDTRNEQGISLGITSQVNRMLTVNASFDRYRHPWHTPLRTFPSSGSETVMEALWRPRQRFELATRYGMRTSESRETMQDSLGREGRIQVARTQHNLRLTASVEPGRRVRLRTRLELVHLSVAVVGTSETGLLVYEDVAWTIAPGLSVEGRLVFFDTESYDSRVYAYENDLRGAFSNPSLYGRGRRWYVLVRSSLIDGVLTLSCKYAATQKDGARTISSGDAEIAGDLDDRFGVQIDLQW